jgi:hypothetical protein
MGAARAAGSLPAPHSSPFILIRARAPENVLGA